MPTTAAQAQTARACTAAGQPRNPPIVVRMAEPLKNTFSPALVRGLADDLARVHAGFPQAAFVRQATVNLERLELMDRARQVCAALTAHLPADYGAALAILVASLGPPLKVTAGFGMTVFRYLPYSQFIAEHGPQHVPHLTASLAALRALTQRFTAEWAIRPFIEQHHDATMRVLAQWVDDHSVHVRRLVSEGTRPRLPWAGRLRCFQQDPTPTLALLDRLVDDPESYVRRSVANHLGDIAKDHPELAVATAQRWITDHDTAERRWIAGHGLRALAKRGHRGALTVLGVGARPRVAVGRIAIGPRRVRIGAAVTIHAVVTARGTRAQDLRIDLVVQYAKADGGSSPKTFRLEQVRLQPADALAINHLLKLADLTTRKHHPGEHRVELQINGERFPLGAFTLMR
jgi:3-methyladenine DNA glycosylase AlkC